MAIFVSEIIFDAVKLYQQKRKCMREVREVRKLKKGLMLYKDDAEAQSMRSALLETGAQLCL